MGDVILWRQRQTDELNCHIVADLCQQFCSMVGNTLKEHTIAWSAEKGFSWTHVTRLCLDASCTGGPVHIPKLSLIVQLESMVIHLEHSQPCRDARVSLTKVPSADRQDLISSKGLDES